MYINTKNEARFENEKKKKDSCAYIVFRVAPLFNSAGSIKKKKKGGAETTWRFFFFFFFFLGLQERTRIVHSWQANNSKRQKKRWTTQRKQLRTQKKKK